MHFIPLHPNDVSYSEDTIKYVCSVLYSYLKNCYVNAAKDNLMLSATYMYEVTFYPE